MNGNIPNDTAGGLNWVLNGVDDPGNMLVQQTGTTNLALFTGATIPPNAFAPALNTGNGNTWWRTSVNLTVTSGSAVTLTDVTFDYFALSGGQTPQPAARRSDFTITLYDPSNAVVGTASILDVIDGSNPADSIPTPVSLVFTTPLALSAPGTYRLEIDGGELGGFDETGNHTAIDNLSINGDVTVVPEPSSALLAGLGVLALFARRRSRR